jgi:hypothetical protein
MEDHFAQKPWCVPYCFRNATHIPDRRKENNVSLAPLILDKYLCPTQEMTR